MYVHVYVHNTKESLTLNLEIGRTNRHSTVVADIIDSALSLVVSQMADPTLFWSAIFMFVWKMADGRQLFVALHIYMYVGTYTCGY